MSEEPKRYYTKGHDKKYSEKFDQIDWGGHAVFKVIKSDSVPSDEGWFLQDGELVCRLINVKVKEEES